MPFHRQRSAPVATIRTGAAVVSKRSRLDGWDTIYSHGGDTKPTTLGVPKPPESTLFQPVTVQLLFERLNGFLYRSGQRGFGQSLRAGYPSFKVSGSTSTVHSTPGRMSPPKRYTRVQRIPRYNAAPKVYRTRASGSGK